MVPGGDTLSVNPVDTCGWALTLKTCHRDTASGPETPASRGHNDLWAGVVPPVTLFRTQKMQVGWFPISVPVKTITV